MYTYCFFCVTAKCRYIACEIKAILGCRVISPKQVQHTWSKGEMTDRLRDLLPGYLLLYSETPLSPERIMTCRYLPGVLRCLRTKEQSFELAGNDEAFAMMLLRQDGVIGKTLVYEENQMIRLTEGAFSGLQAKILKVDHRAHRMQIEIPFVKQLVKTWVEYQIVEKISTDDLTPKE